MKQEELIAERYELALARIKEIPDESICGENYRDYFMQMTDFVLMMGQTYALVEDGALRQMGMEALREHNQSPYADILPAYYRVSYANSDYAIDRLGDTIEKCLS